MAYGRVKSEAHRTQSPACPCCHVSKKDVKKAAKKRRRFLSGEQILKHYVPGYVRQCRHCGVDNP